MGVVVRLTQDGRIALGSLALLVAGYVLGTVSALALSAEQVLSALSACAVVLVVAGRNGHDER